MHRRCDTGTYRRRDPVLVRGRGARVIDSEGRTYIDCTAGLGVATVGHCHPAVVTAIRSQAEQLITSSNLFINEPGALLLEKLVGLAPASIQTGFFCNSGTESVEAAIKFARFSTGKQRFIAAEGGFHGRTLGSLSATHRPAYRRGFEPLLDGFDFAPFNDIQRLVAAVTPATAGIILEIVQGEGGVRVGSAAYFSAVQELCREKNLLLIIDEVQTGFCRTGKLFACEHFDLQPDLLCAAKAVAGGVPMGVTLCSGKIRIEPGSHGSTFGGNPLAAAAALAALEVMDREQLAEAAARKGERLAAGLRTIRSSRILEIRHLGLMVGIACAEPAVPLLTALQERGVLAFAAGESVIRLLPPLVISDEDIDTVIEAVASVMRH
ncbi:acetylornithine/succinylornithine family transaminase [bacterium]|nr:acetylornithine/succinylornithine family transaminase [bacterium]